MREFHAVLKDGAVPLGVLEDKLNRWIAKREALTSRFGTCRKPALPAFLPWAARIQATRPAMIPFPA